MKTTLMLLLSAVTCLVHARPMEHISGFHGPTMAPRTWELQTEPGNTGTTTEPTASGDPNGCGTNGDANVKPAPAIIPSLTGDNPWSPITPPPPGGDFVIQYNDKNDPVHFKYGDCVPLKNDRGLDIDSAEFREAVECFIYQDVKCAKLLNPLPVPFLADLSAPNAVFRGPFTVGGSYNCYKAGTSAKGLLDPNKLLGKEGVLTPEHVTQKGLEKGGFLDPSHMGLG